MEIPKRTWNKYVRTLAKINNQAAEAMIQWAKVNGYDDMQALVDYAWSIATAYGEAAAALACEMYDAIATASRAKVPAAEPAETPTYQEVAVAVYGTAKKSNVEIPSTVGRLVKRVGADTTLKNALRDGAQFAWVPNGDTCAFCVTLASRGWQNMSKKALKNGHAEHIHNNCDCEYAIRFDGKTNVAGYDPDQYAALYYGADGNSPKDRINAMRREFYAQDKDRINEQKRARYAQRRAEESELLED